MHNFLNVLQQWIIRFTLYQIQWVAHIILRVSSSEAVFYLSLRDQIESFDHLGPEDLIAGISISPVFKSFFFL